MNKKILYLMALVAALTASRVAAQSTPPVLINNIVEIDVSDSTLDPFGFTIVSAGTNFSNAHPPAVTFVGGGALLGNEAVGSAIIDDSTGTLTSIGTDPTAEHGVQLTNVGRGYTGDPTVVFTGGTNVPQPPTPPAPQAPPTPSSGAVVTSALEFPDTLETVWGVPNTPFLDFTIPDQNEAYGPSGYTIALTSLASGTHPLAGFAYAFTVNGLSVGVSTPSAPPGTPASIGWTPPLPGVYSIVSTTSDGGGNTAVSPAIRYFALGTAIVSSEAGGSSSTAPGTIVPFGSAIAIQAASTVRQGFVKQVDFYTDWTSTGTTTQVGGTTGNTVAGSGTLIGTSFAYPYNVIYTPQTTPALTHLVKAVAWDNGGAAVTTYPTPNGQLQDQIYLTVANESAAALPTCVIVTPSPDSLVLQTAPGGAGIQIQVSAGAGSAAPAGTNISRVELYVNGVLLATDTSGPYNFTWSPTVTGVYSLTALAYDNAGNVVASTTSTSPSNTPAPTFVSIEASPTVAISSPSVGTSVNSGSTLTVSATVSDPNLALTGTPAAITAATISSVQFFQDGVAVGNPQTTATNGVYTVSFPVNAVAPSSPGGTSGSSSITAIATDSFGFRGTSSPVSITVTTALAAFGTSITSPASENLPTGSSIVVLASAAPPSGSQVQQVDFYTNWVSTGSTHIGDGSSGPAVAGSGTYIGTAYSAPYSAILTPANEPLNTPFVVKAVGWDNNGNNIAGIGTADQITLTMVTPVAGASLSCAIITPTPNSLVEIPNYLQDSTASIPVVVTAGTGATASITKVELYVNGSLYLTDTAYPYTFNWTPRVTGVYTVQAIAYDNHGNSVASTAGAPGSPPSQNTIIVEAAPAVAIISPGNGGTLNGGSTASIEAVATDTNLDKNGNPVGIQQVQFFQDGIFIGVASTPTSGNTYTISFIPVQKLVNGVATSSLLTAMATDTLGFTGNAPEISVIVTSGGTGGNVVIGTPPSVTLTNPANQANVIVNTPVSFSATASAPNGNVSSVSFLVDNAVVTTVTQYPYSATYTFQNLGVYKVIAQVVDNVGDKTSTPAATINVVPEPPPLVSITSPTSGGVISAGTAVTVTASASSPSGTIASVVFFENGSKIGTATSAPYTASFTPLSAGVYSLTAIATDNAGETTTSSASIVEALAATQGLGTASYFGQYQGLTEGGQFAFMVIDGTYGTYIGYENSGPNKGQIFFYNDIPVSSNGNFTTQKTTSSASAPGVSGTAGSTGVSGTVLPTQDILIGALSQATGTAVASGYYTGSLQNTAGSQVTGIVGGDGSIMLYVSAGSFVDVGQGSVDSTGAFSTQTVKGNLLTGTVDPATGFLTGTISGGPGGNIIAARVSGGTFSDGVLTNISTRGQVGTGSNVMIAGFVVGGTVPKQLLVRADGPTLASFGLSGAIKGTQLQIYSGTAVVASNTGWSSTPSNAAAVAAADTQAGAFPFPNGSQDSALVGTFAPGNYTAMVTGTGSNTGLGLVEVYDLDAYSPFSAKKLINISTRGNVGTGANVLIGGFNIDGVAPKRLLIRGAGPALTALNVTGALATPYLELVNAKTSAVVRDNYSWQVGNDSALITSAAQQTGAFAFANGSADSAMLIVLPPGTYTVILSGAQSATGTALVEIYEVP